MRVLFYAINGVGMGHLNRLVCIALELKKKYPHARVLFVTNSDFVGFFYRHNIRYVKLPKDFDNILFTKEDFAFAVPKPVNLKLLDSIVEGFKPQIALFDTHFPEEFVLNCHNRGIQNYLVLREFDSKHIERFVHPGIRDAFERVFIASEGKPQEGFEFVGPIVRLEPYEASIRAKYRIGNREFSILITSGGGGYERETKHFLEQAVRASLRLKKKHRVRIIVVSGPLFKGYKSFVGLPGIQFTRFEERLSSLMRSVDFVISQAGYNACNEILAYKVPTLLLPVYRETDDQKGRAYQLAQKGLCMALMNWEHNKIHRILERVITQPSILEGIRQSLNSLRLGNGATVIANRIPDKPSTPVITLRHQTLTEAISTVKSMQKIDMLVLKKEGFSWSDLQLLMEYLKESGVSEIHLHLQAPIPEGFVKGFRDYPVVYGFVVNSVEQLLSLEGTIRGLKAESLPVYAIVRGGSDIAERLIERLIALRVYSIQIVATRDRASLVPIVNRRMVPENFLFDITIEDSNTLRHPGKKYMAGKEIVELVNQIKGLEAGLQNSLENKAIDLQVGLLEQELKSLLKKPMDSSNAEHIEAGVFRLVNSKKITDRLKELDAELAEAQHQLDRVYSERIRGLEAEKNWLFHERYLLLRRAGVLEKHNDMQKRAEALGRQKDRAWERHNAIVAQLKQLMKAREFALRNSKHGRRVKRLEEWLHKKTKEMDRLWERFKGLEETLEETRRRHETELTKLPQYRQATLLRKELFGLEQRFNIALKKEFEPVRFRVSVLRSKKRLTKEEKAELNRLSKKRDEVWASKLAPLEQQQDILKFKIQELEAKYAQKAGKHNAEISKLESKKAILGKEMDALKARIKHKRDELTLLKSGKEYSQLVERFEKKAVKLRTQQQQASRLISGCEKRLNALRLNQERMIEKAGIKGKYEELNTELSRLDKAIGHRSESLQEIKSYLEFLKQKRDHLLVSHDIVNEYIKYQTLLGGVYRQQAKDEPRIRELKSKLNSLLIDKGLFNKYHSTKRMIRRLEQQISWLQGY